MGYDENTGVQAPQWSTSPTQDEASSDGSSQRRGNTTRSRSPMLPQPVSWAKVTPPTRAVESPASPLGGGGLGASAASVTATSTTQLCPSSPASKKRRGSSAASNGKRGVPHVYHDFANEPETFTYVRKKSGGVSQPFPEKLHEMLDNEQTQVVGWLPHGRAFLVRKPKEFTHDVMSKYFRQTKLTSFQRQLNLYGFRRITQGPDAGAYYHELFLRGRRQLCMRMQRQKVKGTGHKQPSDAQTEPNFYNMPPSTPESQPDADTIPSPPYVATVAVNSVPAHPLALQPYPNRQNTEMSPGLRGLHGAAHLLKGMAAGLSASPNATSVPFALDGSAPNLMPSNSATGASSARDASSSSSMFWPSMPQSRTVGQRFMQRPAQTE